MKRLRIYEMSYDVAFSMFSFGRGSIKLPCVGEMPRDATVVDVHPNYSRRTLDFVVESQEFEEVKPGVELRRFMSKTILVPTMVRSDMSDKEIDNSNYLVEKHHSTR